MAKNFTFTGPDGKSYTVTGPDDATQEQAWGLLQQQLGATQAAPTEQRSNVDEIGRQLGLTVRHAITGLSSLPAVVGNGLNSAINYGIDKVNSAAGTNIEKLPMASDVIQMAATQAGLPEPRNAQERVVGDMTAAMTGVGATAKAGQFLSGTTNRVAQAVGNQLQQGLGAQVVSSATGAGAAGVTRENGGGVAAQIAAGLAGGMAPSLGPAAVSEAVRRGIRGGEAGRQQMVNRMADFEAAGVQPSLGQATGSRGMQAMESMLEKTPGAAGRMAEFAQKQADDMQAAVQRIADGLAPGANATTAGEAIQRGVQSFKAGFKAAQGALYDDLEAVLPKNTQITVDRTRQALAALNEDIPNAPELSKWFKNAKIQGIGKALENDAERAVQQPGANSAMPLADVAPSLPYEAVKKLRTLVGNEITDGGLAADVPRSKWQALYGALSDDLGDAAKAAGPKAEAAWQKANDFTREHMQRLDELSGIVKRDAPEKVFTAAITGTAEGDTVVKRVMNALPMDERREVAAAVLQRLGRATAGQQNAEGDAFSSQTFLTNLAKLSTAARATLFGKLDKPGTDGLIAQLARLAETRREGARVFSNPSGTAQSVAQMGMAGSMGGALVHSLATGNPTALVLAGSAPVVANAGARFATSQNILRKAAEQTQLAPGTQAAASMLPIRLNSAAELPPEKRQVGQSYDLPQGRFVWRGNGWVPAP